MNNLKAGFARVNINPMLGIGLGGYFKIRRNEGILDDLEINALALEVENRQILMLAIDHCGIKQGLSKKFRAHISQATGVAEDAIILSATHTHTAPYLREEDQLDPELENEYICFVRHRLAQVAAAALEDLKPARMGWGIGQAPNVAFVRRFRMKDGSVKTNPGVNHPDILAPLGDVDERVSLLRFDREGADSIALVHFANHPDVVGGNRVSADWPGMLRKTVEKALDHVKCLFFNGAQGDVNHVNVHPTGGYLNDMFMDFDDVARGYAHARYIGRVVTGGVLQAFDKVQYTEVDQLVYLQKTVQIASNRPDPADLPEARRIDALHQAGKDDEIPYEGMMLTTVVAEAGRMLRLENGPDFFEMPLSGLGIGPVALIGIAGEPFTGIGRGLKDTEGFDLVLPLCLTNGSEGYFPMQDAYDEGGYEARSSNFKAGVAERLIAEGKTLLKELGE